MNIAAVILRKKSIVRMMRSSENVKIRLTTRSSNRSMIHAGAETNRQPQADTRQTAKTEDIHVLRLAGVLS